MTRKKHQEKTNDARPSVMRKTTKNIRTGNGWERDKHLFGLQWGGAAKIRGPHSVAILPRLSNNNTSSANFIRKYTPEATAESSSMMSAADRTPEEIKIEKLWSLYWFLFCYLFFSEPFLHWFSYQVPWILCQFCLKMHLRCWRKTSPRGFKYMDFRCRIVWWHPRILAATLSNTF